MFRRVSALSLLLASVFALEALAGDIIVPLTESFEMNGRRYEPRLSATNSADVVRGTTPSFIPAGPNGLDQASEFSRIFLAPNQTARLGGLVEPGEAGMLRLDSAPQIYASAELVSIDPTTQDERVVTSIPTIDGHAAIRAHEVSFLVGLARSASQTTNFTLVNLALADSTCSVEVWNAAGEILASVSPIALTPYSYNSFRDALALLGVEAASGLSFATSCDQPFYHFATTLDAAQDDVHFVLPAASGDTDLGEAEPPPPPPLECGEQDLCFSHDGIFHTAAPGNNQLHEIFDVPAGVEYRRIELQVDFFHGGWYGPEPDGIHNVFWARRNGGYRSNTYGFFTLRGPNRNLGRNFINAGLPRNTGIKADQNLVLPPGRSYHVDYVYDHQNNIVTLTLTEIGSGQVWLNLAHAAGKKIQTGNGEFHINWSDDLPYALGWQFSNLQLQFVR